MDRYDDEPPQEWIECSACEGNGYVVKRVTVYDAGCGFPHDDGHEVECDVCHGAGGEIDERRPDSEGDYCPYRHFTEEESAGWERVFAFMDDSQA